MMQAETNIAITGKGALKDAVRDANLEKVNANFIFDAEHGSLFLNGSMFDEEYKNQWIKYVFSEAELESYQSSMASLALSQGKNSIEMLDEAFLSAEGLTVTSYQTIKEVLEFVCSILGDKNFTVKSSGNTNTYTLHFDLKDIFDLAKLTEEERKNIEKISSFIVESTIVSKEHIPTETKTEITFSYSEKTENIEGTITLTEKIKDINQAVEITLPDSKDVIEQTIK